jgi:hypothetical protein
MWILFIYNFSKIRSRRKDFDILAVWKDGEFLESLGPASHSDFFFSTGLSTSTNKLCSYHLLSSSAPRGNFTGQTLNLKYIDFIFKLFFIDLILRYFDFLTVI